MLYFCRIMIFAIGLSYLPVGQASQAETFMFEFGSSSVSVTSAEQQKEEYHVIVKNRMLVPLKARLETITLDSILPISVPAGKDRAYKFKWEKGKSYRLIPLSPPFEEIFLQVGRPVYEIPPKK